MVINIKEFDKEDPRYLVDKHLIYDEMYEILVTLPPRTQVFLRQRYWENRTLKSIADEAGISATRVREVIIRSVRRLGAPSRSLKLSLMQDHCTPAEWKEQKRLEKIAQAKRNREWEAKREAEDAQQEVIRRRKAAIDSRYIPMPLGLTLEKHEAGSYFIGVPSWAWFSVSDEIYELWLLQLKKEHGII